MTREQTIADAINRQLHAPDEPCETACTHVVIGQWTMLGIANVAGRRAAAVEREAAGCVVCGHDQDLTRINGAPYCVAHVDEGFGSIGAVVRAARGLGT